MNYYTNHQYAAGRLEGTIVSNTDGDPIYVEEVKAHYYLVRKLLDLKLYEAKPEEIDLTPVKLGWYNTDDTAYYITRVPCRKWKQGLSGENIAIDGCYKNKPIPFNLINPNLHYTIRGIYPSYDRVVHDLKKLPNLKKRAFHRQWAVDKDGLLWYSGWIVGSIVHDIPQLTKQNQYLKDVFERQTGVECANF